jgi:putative tricarboxylic transport membrane protein
MSPLDSLVYGFQVLFTAQNLMAVMIGVLTGTAIGVLPGIGPVGAMAILLPITLKASATTALIMLCGIYYGSQYGGSTTAILVNVPGEACSVVTCREGYEMAKKGRAGAALAVAAVGSFVAGTLGIILLMFFAPALSSFALSFGPPEFFAIAMLGLVTLSRIAGGSFWHSLLVLVFGLMVATIGIDPISSTNRYTFGITSLYTGINLVPVVMGLFGIAEIFSVAEKAGGLPQIIGVKFKELFPTQYEWLRSLPAILSGSALGLVLGLLPGPSTILSTFFSYRIENAVSNRKEEWGHGAIEGVAGPESANNAAGVSTLIPMLSLGIPFTSGSAMLLAGLILHGVQAGPLLITEHPEIFWGVVASMYVGNVALLILNFPLVGMWVSLLRIPQSMLLALITLFCLIGSYSVNNNVFDVIVMVCFGIMGYLARKVKFEVSPLVVAVVLGPLFEKTLRSSMYLGSGDPWIFFKRPISSVIMFVIVLILVGPSIWRMISKKKQAQHA